MLQYTIVCPNQIKLWIVMSVTITALEQTIFNSMLLPLRHRSKVTSFLIVGYFLEFSFHIM